MTANNHLRRVRAPRAAIGLIAAIVAGALLASGCAMLESKERELTWRPVRTAASWFGGLPARVQNVYIPVGEGGSAQRIHAWWWPADNVHAPVALYLHGARWNLTGQFRRIAQLREFGFSVLAIDYRGFGASDGELPSEATVYEDAQAAWTWIAQREPDPARRFIYGHSLGGAVAVELAARVTQSGQRAGGLIVESSFTSLADVAAAMSYQWLPVGLILSQKFDSAAKIGELAMPVLIVHGANDAYVPPRLSEALFEQARGPKKLLLVSGASHNNSMWVGEDEYREAIATLFGVRAEGAAETASAKRRVPNASGGRPATAGERPRG